MVVIGIDTHKATHTLVGVDPGGRKLKELTVRATTAGHLKALDWARRTFGLEIVWGIEDCRNLSRRLERDLLDAGQRVVRVPPQLMARTRASARTRGKSDPIDALPSHEQSCVNPTSRWPATTRSRASSNCW